MGNINSTPTKKIYMRPDRMHADTFSIKVPANANIKELRAKLSTYLEQNHVTAVSVSTLLLKYGNRPIDDEVRVSALFSPTKSKYFNSKENPVLFLDQSHELWVKVKSVRDVKPFQVAINAVATVSQLRISIQTVQASSFNQYEYGNGVASVYYSKPDNTHVAAAVSEYVCNLGVNTYDSPVLFSESGPPVDVAALIASRVVAIYRDSRSGAPSSKQSIAVREAHVDTTGDNN